MDGYKIKRTRERSMLNLENGNVEDGLDVTVFDTVTNTTFSVFLPDENVSGDNARQLIEDKLQRIRDIHELSE